ncbi:MAG: tetratricopeptide repeat protein [Methylophilaceae bacterium]
MNDDLFKKATLAHSKNNLDEAEDLYFKILKNNLDNHQIHFLLGTLFLQKKIAKKALSHLKKVECHDKNNPHLLMNLGLAYKEIGDYELSETYLKKSLSFNPEHADYLNNLGTLYLLTKNYVEAELNFRKALKLRADEAAFLINLSECLSLTGNKDEAINLLLKIDVKNTLYKEAQKKLFIIYLKYKNYQEAINCGKQIIGNEDDNSIAGKMIHCFLQIGNVPEAENLLAKLDSDKSQYAFYQGTIEIEKGNHNRAEKIFTQLLKKQEYSAPAHHNLGMIKFKERLFDEAIAHFKDALDKDQGYLEAKTTMGLCQLSQCQFASGWKNYLSYKEGTIFNFAALKNVPHWNGHSKNKIILIMFDQGLGDQIFFAKLLTCLDKGNQYICVINKKLINLFSASFKQNFRFISMDQINESLHFDFQCIASGLGKMFIKDISDLNTPSKFISSQYDGLNEEYPIGISWFSSNPVIGRKKSISLDALISKLKNKSRYFINLQYGDYEKEIKAVEKKHQVTFIEHGNDNFNNLDQLARVILGCKEVYTISNTTAHLSSALGQATTVILPYNHEFNTWYWFSDKQKKSLWYANTRIVEAHKNDPIESALELIS